MIPHLRLFIFFSLVVVFHLLNGIIFCRSVSSLEYTVKKNHWSQTIIEDHSRKMNDFWSGFSYLSGDWRHSIHPCLVLNLSKCCHQRIRSVQLMITVIDQLRCHLYELFAFSFLTNSDPQCVADTLDLRLGEEPWSRRGQRILLFCRSVCCVYSRWNPMIVTTLRDNGGWRDFRTDR